MSCTRLGRREVAASSQMLSCKIPLPGVAGDRRPIGRLACDSREAVMGTSLLKLAIMLGMSFAATTPLQSAGASAGSGGGAAAPGSVGPIGTPGVAVPGNAGLASPGLTRPGSAMGGLNSQTPASQNMASPNSQRPQLSMNPASANQGGANTGLIGGLNPSQ